MQTANSSWARTVLGITTVLEYSERDLEDTFLRQHEEVFKYRRGGGYWVWKPFIILKTMRTHRQFRYLIYCDSGSRVDFALAHMIQAATQSNGGIALITFPHYPNGQWTKRDAFLHLGADTREHHVQPQSTCTFLVLDTHNNRVAELMTKWQHYTESPLQLVSDKPSVLGKELPRFREHRHTQSLLTILMKQMNIVPGKIPCTAYKQHAFGTGIKADNAHELR